MWEDRKGSGLSCTGRGEKGGEGGVRQGGQRVPDFGETASRSAPLWPFYTLSTAERQPSFGSWLVIPSLSSAVSLDEFTTQRPGGFLDEFIHSSVH